MKVNKWQIVYWRSIGVAEDIYHTHLDRDKPTLPMKAAEHVYSEPEGAPKTTILHNPAL